MPNRLPAPVAAYLGALASRDAAALDNCLAVDARVNDAGEDEVITGLERVKEWFASTTEQFKLAIEIRDVREETGATVVAVLTSGDFPGSPLIFNYHFAMTGGKIAAIEIIPE